MRMYFDYIKERENLDYILLEDGFATYRIDGDMLFVSDIYVDKDTRKSTCFFNMYKKLIEIGKKKGCKVMGCSVYLNTNDPTLSLRAILSAGFRLLGADEEKISLIKDI